MEHIIQMYIEVVVRTEAPILPICFPQKNEIKKLINGIIIVTQQIKFIRDT